MASQRYVERPPTTLRDNYDMVVAHGLGFQVFHQDSSHRGLWRLTTGSLLVDSRNYQTATEPHRESRRLFGVSHAGMAGSLSCR